MSIFIARATLFVTIPPSSDYRCTQIEGAGGKVRATLQPGLTNRLTKYLRTTQQLIEEGRDAVSSKELGDFTGINPVQVRRDLNAIGFSGTRGVGYQAYDLVEEIGRASCRERVQISVV